MTSYGRHAHGRGRHRAPAKTPLGYKLVILLVLVSLFATLAPLALGVGLVFGVLFGWLKRGLTKF